MGNAEISKQPASHRVRGGEEAIAHNPRAVSELSQSNDQFRCTRHEWHAPGNFFKYLFWYSAKYSCDTSSSLVGRYVVAIE
jgi:hypothetical protein